MAGAEGGTSQAIPSGGEPVPIAAGAVHTRDLELIAGELLHVVVGQRGVDLAVALRDAAGEVVWDVNSPNGRHGPEELVGIVPATGRYRLEIVAPADVESGFYTFEEVARRRATDDDRNLVAADRAYHRGRELRRHDPREAIATFHRAAEAWRRLAVPHREAATLYELCQTHRGLGHNRLAFVFCDRAAELYADTGDRRRTAVALDTTGYLRLRLGQTARAVEYLEEALELYLEVGFETGAALCLGRLGAAHHWLGELDLALTYLEDARERIGTEVRLGNAGILTDLGDLLTDLNRLDEAGERYGEALGLYRKLDHAQGIVTALQDLAVVEARLVRFDDAADHLQEAFGLVGDLEDPLLETRIWGASGLLYRLRGDLERAHSAFQKALALARQAGDTREEAYSRMELGHLATRRGEPREGLVNLEAAAAAFARLGDPRNLASARARSAEALRDLGELDEARRRILLALDGVEDLRARAPGREVRTGYFAFRQDYYEIAIEILMRTGRSGEAFRIHERRLARELRDTLAGRRERRGDPALRQAERNLEEQLRELAGRLPVENLSESAELRRLLAELRRLWGEIETAGRETAPPSDPAIVGIEETREDLLDEETLLLSYALGKEGSYLWAISREGSEVHRLPSRDLLEKKVRKLLALLALPGPHHEKRVRQAGRGLSEDLLGPVADRLDGQRLAVVADAVLLSVPFAALTRPGTDDEYLLRTHEVVVLPSVSTLALLRRAEAGRPAPPDTIAAFADPVFRAQDPRLGGSPSPRAGPEVEETPRGVSRDLERLRGHLGFDPWERLPSSGDEARAILAAASEGPHLLAMGLEATRERFFGLAAGEYRVLHFATHAVASSEQPELSGLVLSLVGPDGHPIDGYVRAYEIARLDLPFELVSLSACRTGAGKELRGEGALGLARAFLDAGATRVVASLWKVDDRATAELMTRFYEAFFTAGLPASAALRRAQLALADETKTASPYAWAAFVLQGDWRRPAPTPTIENRSEQN